MLNLTVIRCSFVMLCSIFLCMPATGYTTGLGEILHRVEKNAPQLNAASARANAAEAGVRVAKSQYWGHAELLGRDSHFNNDRLVNPISYPPVLNRSSFDRNSYAYGAVFTLPLDIDGRISAKMNAQKHLSLASLAGVKQTRLSLFGQAVGLYRGLQRLDGVKKALEEQLKALQGHEKITLVAVRVGRVAAVELLRIKAEIKSVEGALAGLSGDEAIIRAHMGALLNEPLFLPPVELLSENPVASAEMEPSDGILLNRPDISAAGSITKAGDEDVKGARREWLPNLSLQVETMRAQGYTAQGQNIWAVSAQMSWQFWDGGRRFAHADQAGANREVAHQQYQSTLNLARAELQSAAAGWKSSALQYEAAAAGLQAALETERIQSDRFTSGRISSVDLIDAEAALARSRSNYTSALTNWWLADDQLHLARGEAPVAYKQ